MNGDKENNTESHSPEENKPVDYSHFLKEEKEEEKEITKEKSISSFGDLRKAINDPQKKNQVLIALLVVLIIVMIFILRSFLI